MKRIVSTLLATVLILCCIFTLASCSNATESYAKKINLAAEKGEYYTYTEVLDDLGDEAIDLTVAKNGTVIAVKGCTNWDEIEDKIDNNETVKGIVILMALGKAISAEYREIDLSDKN